ADPSRDSGRGVPDAEARVPERRPRYAVDAEAAGEAVHVDARIGTLGGVEHGIEDALITVPHVGERARARHIRCHVRWRTVADSAGDRREIDRYSTES